VHFEVWGRQAEESRKVGYLR